MESNKRARTTEGEAPAPKEMIQSLRDQMAKRKAELATLRAELRRALSETREGDVQSTIASLRGGATTVFEVIAEQLPDVFYGEIMPKIDIQDTLNLAQVSKKYRDLVWSVGGVRSFEAKIESQLRSAVGIEGPIDECSKPMLWAAENGNLPAIRAILQSGVDVNMSYGDTALHVAAEYDQLDAVKLLLEAGADPNIQIEGYTALNWHLASARHEQNPLLVRALIQAGTDVKIPSNRLSTPLHFTDCAACAMMLIDAGADINAVNKKGQSPLRHAILDNRPAGERLLRRFKALDIGP